MIGIEKELAVFLAAILAGNLICLVYTTIRVFRRIVKHSLFWISMEDIVFWVITGIYLFSEMYRTCSGSIRWYFVTGVFLGGIFTAWILRKIKKMIDKCDKKE